MLIKVALVFVSNLISSILIVQMASVTTKEVFIRCFKLSNSSFEKIFKAACNSDRIVFRGCLLDLDSDIDISGPEYKTTYFSFRYTGNEYCSNWGSFPSRLKKILKAISLSSLKTSLLTLDVYEWGFEVSKVEEMLKEFNLEHVKIVKEDAMSLDE